MSNLSFGGALCASLVALYAGYALTLFPGRRVVTWFELCTDGLSPDWLASDAQDVVGTHWKEALHRGDLNEVSEEVIKYLDQWGGGDVLELCAGSGMAPAVWHDLFQEKGLCTRTVLTDIQPKGAQVHLADVNSEQDDEEDPCGSFHYIRTPVDATKAQSAVQDIVPSWGANGRELRMIHLSLHHFDPTLVQEILQDATRSNAAILIADHSPTAGGVLYNGVLANKQLIKIIPRILMRNPIKVLLAPFLPIILAGSWHDSTVSILRAYSQAELRQLLLATNEGKDYNVQMYKSGSYGEWLGIPKALWLPGMGDHVVNFMFATPPSTLPAPSQHFSPAVQDDPKTINDTLPTKIDIPHHIPESPPVPASMQILLLMLIGVVSYKFVVDDKAAKKKKQLAAQGLENAELIGKPALLAVGTANPPHVWTSDHVNTGIDWKRQNLNMDDAFVDFMKRVHQTSGVESRYFGVPPPDAEKIARGERPEGMYAKDGWPTVSERHAYWAEWAPKMAIEAATKAVDSWGGNRSDITHVIFHSCTGFKAPGVELDVIDALKLTGVKRRLGINYMGCFGGFTGMSVAKAFCDADPTATVLLVCAETCYAHIAFCDNRSKTIGNCFFADGGAAAVIGAGRPGDWVISDQQTKTLGEKTRGLMTWQPSDCSYDMYLDKGIGYSFGMHLYWNLKSYLRGICKESVHDIEWCVHPGGKGILDFFCSEKLGLGIDKNTLRLSYDVLRRYGNMSSGTIFFVLQDLMKEAKEHPTEVKSTAVCFGFGPGLTLEIAELRRIGSEAANHS